MHNISYKHVLVTTLFLAIVITGCAGRDSNSIQAHESIEQSMSCSEIRDEKDYVDKQITALNPDAKKNGRDWITGVAGAINIAPWLSLGMSSTGQEKVKIYQSRYVELDRLYDTKNCNQVLNKNKKDIAPTKVDSKIEGENESIPST